MIIFHTSNLNLQKKNVYLQLIFFYLIKEKRVCINIKCIQRYCNRSRNTENHNLIVLLQSIRMR